MPSVAEFTGGSVAAEHLCVLVHGLWGNPDHLGNIAKSLREQYGPDRLRIFAAKRNSGNFTYDGIEVGGERLCQEVEEELQSVAAQGGKIKKLSIVGYSLGGLVARYAIGLLFAKGVLDELECVNFTTFATPHLGVRSPIRGLHNRLWNVIAPRTLSMSGRQLFLIDKFRDTGRPLLSVLTEPGSIFMCGLAKFRRRTLYTNIVNDRSAVYYTTGITKTDPYRALDDISVNFLGGYEDVILDPAHPVSPRPKTPAGSSSPRTLADFSSDAVKHAKNAPLVLALMFFIPIGLSLYMVNAAVQNVRSSQRRRLHEMGLAGIPPDMYRFPLMRQIGGAVEDAYEEINASHDQEYLVAPGEDADEAAEAAAANRQLDEESTKILALERRKSHPWMPTLALEPSQFAMIEELDRVGWRKFPVWIHKVSHSHAAMIVRIDKESFSEGWTVLGHWMKEEFIFE